MNQTLLSNNAHPREPSTIELNCQKKNPKTREAKAPSTDPKEFLPTKDTTVSS